MKNFLIFLAICFKTVCFSQLYVSPSNYVYVADQFLFVKEQVQLQNNSTLFLRKEAQLLQGSSTTSNNVGQGKISIFQEGTVNAYQYNFWCSPIGNASISSGNENFGITMLNAPTSLTNSNPANMISDTYEGIANPLGIASYWIFKFIQSSTMSDWSQVGEATSIAAGEGFTMKGTGGTDATTVLGIQNNSGNNQRYDFRGKPNDGNITISLANNQFTLTGNPYPSAIDLSAFLTAATNCTGVAYFWEQDKTTTSHLQSAYKGGYGTYAPITRGGTGVYVPATFYSYDGVGAPTGVFSNPNNSYQRFFCPVGQGFMILGNNAGTTAVMNNSYRVFAKEGNANFSQFERNTNSNTDFLPQIPSVSGFDYTQVSSLPVPQIRFNVLLNNQGIRQIVLAFEPTATNGIDHGMDATLPSETSPADAYFSIQEKEYVLNVVPFDINQRFPVGFKSTDGSNFKITVKEILNFSEVENVYLHDKINDVYHDIKNDFYDMDLATGDNFSQFEITFNNITLSNNQAVKKDFIVFQNNTSKLLTIQNTNLLDIQSIQLFDIAGKQIFDLNDLKINSKYELPTSNLADGIYVVRVKTEGNETLGQKIVIKN